MKRIAVIGANGYIARNLVYFIKCNFPDYKIDLYGLEETFIDGDTNYVSVDMTDRSSVKNLDLSCDVVFMLAGKTGSFNGFYDFDSFIDINQKALLNLLSEYIAQKSSARIVFPSTRLVYKGNAERLKEDSEKEFKTVYAINKFSCEQYLEQFGNVFNVSYTILRICVPYGSLIANASSYGTAEFMLQKAMNGKNITLYGDGSSRRTITYIEDICSIMLNSSFSDRCLNDVFNIGGEDYSLKEMAELISRKFGVGIDYVPWPTEAIKIESGDTVFDSNKIDLILKCSYSKFDEWIIKD